jgi:hypothetical protein
VNPGFVHDEFAMAFQRKKPTAVGVNAPYPGFIEPELATSVDKVPSGAGGLPVRSNAIPKKTRASGERELAPSLFAITQVGLGGQVHERG